MPNVNLLQGTLAYIEANPETWNQGEWVCGTTMCFAGHAVALSGIHVDGNTYIPIRNLPDDLRSHYEGMNSVHVARLAAKLLDISDGETPDWDEPAMEWDSDRLFYGDNTLEELREIVDELCAESAAVSS